MVATPAPRPLAISVSPARLALAPPASRTITLSNLGAQRVVIGVARKSVSPRTRGWLSIRPARLALRAGSSGRLTLRARTTPAAEPGDHRLLVLLVGRPVNRRRVAVRLRLGIRVRVRIAGRIVRQIDLGGLRVRRRAGAREVLVSIANRGNVTEHLRGRLRLKLIRGHRVVSELRPRGIHELAPRTRVTLALPYAGHTRGLVRAVVTLGIVGMRPLVRMYRLRL